MRVKSQLVTTLAIGARIKNKQNNYYESVAVKNAVNFFEFLRKKSEKDS